MTNRFFRDFLCAGSQRRVRRTSVAVLASIAMLSGCSYLVATSTTVRQTIAPQPTTRSAEQKDALLNYVDAERATIPSLLEATSGVYSDITVEATFEVVKNNKYLPDGIHAVIWFDYTYVPDYDLAAAYDQIEASETAVKKLCDSKIFPLMRNFGIGPPYGATFTYHAAQKTIGPLNTLSCNATR